MTSDIDISRETNPTGEEKEKKEVEGRLRKT
jgi:hypothetical protein